MLAEGQLLRDGQAENRGKSPTFKEGTRIPTASSKEEQLLDPLHALIGRSASKWSLLMHTV
jgi:hypothetical protein